MSLRIRVTQEDIHDAILLAGSTIASNLGSAGLYEIISQREIHPDDPDNRKASELHRGVPDDEWYGEGFFRITVVSAISLDIKIEYNVKWWWSHPSHMYVEATTLLDGKPFGGTLEGEYRIHDLDDPFYGGELGKLSLIIEDE